MKKLFLLITAVCMFLTGCGYTMQSRANLPFHEIDLGRVENKTHEPKLEDRLARAIGLVFPEYGFDISPHAGYRLECDIETFTMTVLSEIGLTAAEYQIATGVTMRLVETKSGKVTVMKPASPFVTYFRSTGRIEAVMAQKELATDRAMRDVAQRAAQEIIYKKELFAPAQLPHQLQKAQ
ncbi:MAG TPA: LPS assembly lipoprotein LptE [Dissulfurispiraceae bacterium]|nr:LPS assembly lipoprotein LptE [Dissulfurispiraceae bacterium]